MRLPENAVQIFEFYDLFRSHNVAAIGGPLEQAMAPIDTHPGSPTRAPQNVLQRANEVKAARRALQAFLTHTAISAQVPDLAAAYSKMYVRDFATALPLLSRVGSHPGLPEITQAVVEAAYSGPISYAAVILGPPDPEGEPTTIDVTRTIVRGYEGPPVPAADLVRLKAFMTTGRDSKRLLENECFHGRGGGANLVRAIHGYAALLPPAVTDPTGVLGARDADGNTLRLFVRYEQPQHNAAQTLAVGGVFAAWRPSTPRQITPRQQFVALRSAQAHLALGDHLWRGHRVITGADRIRLGAVYAAAADLAVRSGVSADNALRKHIEAYAARQRAKLAAGLNALGFWDAFVPPQRFSALEAEVNDAVDQAENAASAAVAHLNNAEDSLGRLLDLDQQARLETENAEIYRLKIDVSWMEEDKADEQVEMISDQLDALILQSAASAFSAFAAISPTMIGGGVPAAIAGVVSAGVDYWARSEELLHQKKMAKIDVDIAQVQTQIAQTELYLSRLRRSHLEQKAEFEQNRRINADMLLLLTDMYEKRAARLLDAAIIRAYLAERALAFARGEQIPPVIRLNYWDDPKPGEITRPERLDPIVRLAEAIDSLRADFDRLTDLTLRDEESPQLIQEHLSLRDHYPLEFAKLLQDGEMHFEYSMYQLSKRFPPAYKCRLYDQAVEVIALGPPSGARGVLEHTGAFLVRQHDATMAATRLVPTDEQLEAALRQQREDGRGVASVGGHLYYVLPPNRLLSTLKSQLISADAPSDLDDDELREGLEGYGPTGVWRLKIFNLDELQISDIIVHFGLVAGAGDQAFERKVEQLVDAYEGELSPDGEPLDRISAFSVRQRFPDAFAALSAGVGRVELAEDEFPSGLDNLRFKALVAQALDDQGRGVEGIGLSISRPDTGFTLQRVTVAGGFSEDLSGDVVPLPVEQRFPVQGVWELRLGDPQQFSRLGDLLLFVMYSYE